MSDMRDALNELARRGAPRGFDEVLAGAAESAARESVARDSAGDDLDTIPFVMSEPLGRARGRRRPLSSMITAAGVAVLLLVGAFAVSAIVGSGGAGSAESAVRQLADAVSHEDALTAADVLAPDEVRSLHGTLDHAARKASDLQLVQNASAPLAGVDFNVDGLDLSTQSLGDGYAKVTIDAGTLATSTHKARFSALMQKVLRESSDNSSQTDLAKLAADQNLPTFVVAVRRSGRWYVSAAYTALEYVREENQLPAADFGSGARAISTLGADSPDAAVQDSMRAFQSQDWSKLMTMVSPSEIPVYDYRNALTTLAQRNKAESGGSTSSFTIDSMTTDSQVSGDTAKVLLRASGTTDSGNWSLDGGCFVPTDRPGAIAVTCGGAGRLGGLRASPLSALDKDSRITVVKQNGRWFVSPVGTVLDVLDHWITQVDRRSLFTLLDIPNQIPPDGALTLGRPIVVGTATNLDTKVLTFEGRNGESLLGLATTTATPSKSSGKSSVPSLGDEYPVAQVRVFAPDGSELQQAGGILGGQPLTLPADGRYTFVVQNVGDIGFAADVTVTIWDEQDAPAAAKQNRSYGAPCTYTIVASSCSYASAAPSSIGSSTETSVAGPTPTAAVTTAPHG